MHDQPDVLGASSPERAAMVSYYTGMYSPLAQECYSYVHSVAAEMDDPVNHPYVPKERFNMMVDRVLDRLEGRGQAKLSDLSGVDSDFGRHHRHHRKKSHHRSCDDGNPLCSLIVALLIGELLKRRKCC